MIKLRLRGRLGNQLFQYAFAYLFSKRLKTFFLLDTNFQLFELGYFKLNSFYRVLNNSGLLKVYNLIQRSFTSKIQLDFRDCFQEYNYSNVPVSAYLDGYFQDYRLYADHKKELSAIFKVKKKYQKVYNKKYKKLQAEKKTIVVSFRFGDYASFNLFNDSSVIIPINWYSDVLKKIDLKEAVIFCISDDIGYVEKNFEIEHEQIFFVKDDMITQLLLLQKADISIISNSTFAWWGAFLNEKSGMVYCPQYFLGFPVGKEIPPCIYPLNWKQVPVNK